jgi:broad specificity phosphatase PhoE
MSQQSCTLYVVRHAESSVNAGTSLPSHYDEYGSSLTEQGKKQAQALATALAHVPFAAFYASDLRQAYETAQIVANGSYVQTLVQLRERFHRDGSDELETPEEAVERLNTVLKNIAQAHIGQVVIVVAHGFTMRALLVALGFASFTELPGGSITNTGYIVLTAEGEQLYLDHVVGVRAITGSEA